MEQNTHAKYATLESFVSIITDLSVDIVINESLRNVRKLELERLIDEALMNKNEEAFMRYTADYKQLEDFFIE